MNDCIFCKIIKNELPSKTIYEDDLIKVIMNINPTTNGHLLVLPKTHYENILDINEDVVMHSFKVIREKLYPLLKEKLNCKGLTISENNFLGQEIKHFHIHLTPRYENDLVDFNYNKELLNDIDEIYSKLTSK
jgi:histidine triad (HIT) family protein